MTVFYLPSMIKNIQIYLDAIMIQILILMYNILVHILNYCTTKSRMVGIDWESLKGAYFHYSHPKIKKIKLK